MKNLKTMIKITEGVGTSFTETMVMFDNNERVAKQEFMEKENAISFLDSVESIMKKGGYDWELAITCDDVELNGKNVLDFRVLESEQLDSTCFLYIIEE